MSRSARRGWAGSAALIASIAIGIALLAAPELFSLSGGARLSLLIAGPIAASAATIARWAVARPLARVNLVIGGWLVAAPLVFDHGGWWLASVAAGAALAALAVVPEGQPEHYGGGWSAVGPRGR